MANINFTIPDEQAAVLTARHGDIATWLKGLAVSEFDNANARIAEEAFRGGILRRRPDIAKMVADGVRGEKSEPTNGGGSPPPPRGPLARP